MKFRKKPVVIEAMQYDGSFGSQAFIVAQLGGQWHIDRDSGRVSVLTLEGAMTVSPGDWVIRGVAGEVYPCKPDIFAQTYEPVED